MALEDNNAGSDIFVLAYNAEASPHQGIQGMSHEKRSKAAVQMVKVQIENDSSWLQKTERDLGGQMVNGKLTPLVPYRPVERRLFVRLQGGVMELHHGMTRILARFAL